MSRIGAWIVVAISGAAVLALEILGTRILGPFYGVSLYLWSALIGVTLLALAAGYALGGRWADRDPRASRLTILFAAAAVWLIIMPALRTPLLRLAEPLGLRAAVLVAATLLFAPPLTLLGMVSPFVIRLRAGGIAEVGRTAGDLFAISTVAGVLSALATGFWLIPSVGVSALVRLIAAALFVAAAVARLDARSDAGGASRERTVAPVLLLVAATASGGLAVVAGAPGRERPAGLLAERESPYGEIRVVQHDEKRYLLIDGGIHTVVAPDTWQTYFAYVPVLDIPRMFFDAPGRLLLIGLGGGSTAKSYAAAGWRVDAVEIDPEVTRIAREFFGLAGGEAVVHRADGRAFLESHPGPWDIVAVDAFGSSSIPFHLASVEAFRLIASRLGAGGLLAMNIEAVGWQDPLVGALARTLGQAFAHVTVLPIIEPPDQVGNLVLLASNRPLEFDEDRLGRPFLLLPQPYKHWCSVQMNHAWSNRFVPRRARGPLITDDRNPVDVMTERVNRAARMSLHANPDLRGIAWQ